MKTRFLAMALWLVALVPGTSTVLICSHYILLDYAALRRAYANWHALTMRGADLRAITIAETHQNIFRLNVFAEGIWILMGFILCAIGVHGLCLLKRD